MTPINLAAILDPSAPPSQPFIIELGRDGEERRRVSWAEARAEIAALARGLLRRGLRRGDAVAIVALNSADYLLTYLATMAAGLVSVPVNYKLPRETVEHLLRDSKVRLAVVDEDRRALIPDGVPVAVIGGAGADALSALRDPGAFSTEDMRADEVAMVLYTSGSTGLPKGVPLTHGGYIWATSMYADQRPVIHGKPVLVAAPLFHMNGLYSAKNIMVHGGTILLMTEFGARGYIRAIDRYRVSMITSVPTMLALVLREADELAAADLSCVENVMTGSAPSTSEFFANLQATFPKAMVWNSWGTTESGPIGFGPHPDGVHRPIAALGYPRREVEIKLVGDDPDIGVLYIKTPALMSGYLNRPGDTAKRMKDGWYDTGDVVRRDENGFIFFVGRADDMFLCGGENVYPGEVEKILNQHPAVLQAAVVPVPDEIKYQVPVAFVVLKPGAKSDEAEIRRFALENGPAYAHPRAVWFLDTLPLAGTNKIDRAHLERRARAAYDRAHTRRV
jgi:long-chain acyl-CoA synthetase